jgi:predicted ATP-dependent endonuclease of OLD family
MERLFLDNFRGFSEQYIEIRDVNFLVGENSSGKSSVLMALNTISYPGFWFNLDFNAGDSQTFSFDDLVSVESNNKSYFRIGYFDDRNTSFVFEFTNLSGKPIISSGGIGNTKSAFYFFCEGNQIKHKDFKNEDLSLDRLKNFSKKEKSQMKELVAKSEINAPLMILSLFEKNIFPGKLPIQNITPIAPIRSKPKKTYDEPGTSENSEGDHIPYVIRRILKTKHDFLQRMKNFGEMSGLFRDINIKEYEENVDDAPFRMNFILNKEPINIVNIGYGVSQILPVLYTVYTQNNSIITIQQPEVHLHPKAQAAMGNVFFDLSIGKSKKKFIIETHSDYIIDRFRQTQRKSQTKSHAQVVFFLRENGGNKAFSINIDGNGNYDSDQPEEFRAFFIREKMENLGL